MDKWCKEQKLERGGIVTIEQMWRLAKEFYQGKLKLDWSPKSKSEKQELFTELGLPAEFWKL